MKKYIDFHAIAPFIYNTKRVTSVYAVTSLSSGHQLGIIKWHPQWRQYCFFPDLETVWSNDCLENVQSILRGLNFAHKHIRKMKKQENHKP